MEQSRDLRGMEQSRAPHTYLLKWLGDQVWPWIECKRGGNPLSQFRCPPERDSVLERERELLGESERAREREEGVAGAAGV